MSAVGAIFAGSAIAPEAFYKSMQPLCYPPLKTENRGLWRRRRFREAALVVGGAAEILVAGAGPRSGDNCHRNRRAIAAGFTSIALVAAGSVRTREIAA